MKQLTVEALRENLPQVLGFIDAELEGVGCPMKTQMQIDLAVEEIFVNIASYAYHPDTGEATVGIEIEDGSAVSVVFTDSGIPYAPLSKADPDVTLSAEDRDIGGLGIFMTKKCMDDITYEYKNGMNVLCLKKEIGR